MKLGLIGYPLGHTLSPLIQNAMLEQAGILGSYEAWPIIDLAEFVAKLQRQKIDGFNITIPYKEKILPYLQKIDPIALKIGAVNTVVIKQGKLTGYNTDLAGFLQPLAKFKAELKGETAVVLGAGGAARAACYGLISLGMTKIYLVNRDEQRAVDLIKECKLTQAELCSIKDITSISAKLLVNTTPVGMYPNFNGMPALSEEVFQQQTIFYDLIYRPKMTLLLQKAHAAGCLCINGMEMLIEQAAAAFFLWTGFRVDTKSIAERVQGSFADEK
ncbi:MAG: shikimate dehydrogenase [Clostridia bacterium]